MCSRQPFYVELYVRTLRDVATDNKQRKKGMEIVKQKLVTSTSYEHQQNVQLCCTNSPVSTPPVCVDCVLAPSTCAFVWLLLLSSSFHFYKCQKGDLMLESGDRFFSQCCAAPGLFHAVLLPPGWIFGCLLPTTRVLPMYRPTTASTSLDKENSRHGF